MEPRARVGIGSGPWRLAAQGLSLLVVAGLVAGLVVVTRQPEPAAGPAPRHLQVGLEAPGLALVGDVVPVQVTAAGRDPIERVELWIGAEMADAIEPSDGTPTAALTMHWTATEPGSAQAVARAFDAAGRIGTSNGATIAIGSGLASFEVVDEGGAATLSEMAQDAGVDLAVALAMNPHVEPDEELVPGSAVLLPGPIGGSGGTGSGGGSGGGGGVSPTDAPEASPEPALGPSATQTLGLEATVDGCAVSLVVSGLTPPGDRPDGWSIEILRHPPLALPVPVGPVENAGTQVSVADAPGAGTHVYSASETGAAGAVSPMVSVDVAPDCDGEDGSRADGGGGLSLLDGILHVAEPVDGIFVYLTAGGTGTRIPDDPGEIVLGDRGFDLRQHVGSLPDSDVDLEVWGRIGTDVKPLGNLHVASSELVTPATELHAIVDIFGTELPVKSITANTKQTVHLEWSSSVAHHGVRWFLARYKPNDATSLSPGGVIQSGLAVPKDGAHRFDVDLSENTTPKVVSLSEAQLPVTEAPVIPGAGGGGRRLPPGPSEEPGTTWAWAVPVDEGGAVVGPASDPVRVVVTLAPYDPQDKPPYDVLKIKLDVPPAPNPALANCVRIISQSPKFPRGWFGQVYLSPDGSTTEQGVGGVKVSGTLPYQLDSSGIALYPFTACPGERDTFQWGKVGCGGNPACLLGKAFTELGEAAVQAGKFLVDLANKASAAYNDLKNWAIDQVASAICPSAVADECRKAIAIGVDVMLTAVGVPPSMPNFDDLADLAKGEAVDLALDQLGVGEACDAIAAGTGKTCGELASDLDDLDACTLAGDHEDDCRDLVAKAQQACQIATDAAECDALTTDAQDLVKAGYGEVYDRSVAAIQQEVSDASLQALGFHPGAFGGGTHDCWWGGPDGTKVICPPPQKPSLFPPTGGWIPTECWYGNFGQEEGKIVCAKPPIETVATPEPLGQHQPMRVDVALRRNHHFLPSDYECGPIHAVATTITPRGAVGEPYLAASVPMPKGSGFLGTDLHFVTLWLGEPNPHAEIPADKRPPAVAQTSQSGGIGTTQHVLQAVGPGYDWAFLLEGGSLVGVKIYGDCIAETHAEGAYGVAGKIPPPQPRITPGAP